ncbi:hypothetical protein JCM3770_005271 [Rhodotorula araucariae]
MVHQANKHCGDNAGVFRAGDLVYLSTTSHKFPEYLAGKFLPRYIGPYEIVVADKDDAEFKVEKVVAVKGPSSRRLFKVRWLSYSLSTDLWRPEVELRELAPDALDAFLKIQASLATRGLLGVPVPREVRSLVMANRFAVLEEVREE